MKRTAYSCILLFMLASLVYGDEIRREFDISRGGQFKISTEIGGEIYIRGWDKDKIEVKGDATGLDPDDYVIDYNATSSVLEIEIDKNGRWRNRDRGNIDFAISIPTECNVEIETAGGPVGIKDIKGTVGGQTAGGSLEFDNIVGDIDFKTMGGSVSARKIDGKLDLETMGGSITVSDSKADGTVKTMGGSIMVENVQGHIDGSTMGGSVNYRNVSGKSSGASAEVVRVSTMGGSISVDEAPNGADLETKGGSIDVNVAGKYVKAETMGGSITIREVDGGVDASTMGGSVTINMVGDPDKGDRDVYISSKGGDIDLTVPPGLSMDFDIELAYTRNSDQDYDIYSDFDIKKEKTKEWEGSRGSKRKYIYGTGEYQGGKNKIRISTINGDVYVREGRN